MPKVTTFRHAKDNEPMLQEATWEQLCADLGEHRVAPGDKTMVPAFCPAEWPPGVTRGKRTVLRVHFGVLDVDKVPESSASRLLDRLESEGLAHCAYTTWSHAARNDADGTWSLRVLVPFSRPVEAAEWREFWPRMNDHFGGVADQSCKDPSRIYFVPSAPGDDPRNVVVANPGVPLDVEAVLARPVPVAPANPAPSPVSAEDLRGLADVLLRKRSHSLRAAGHVLRHALAGEPFAAEGNRDDAMFRTACVLAEQLPPDVDPAAVAEHFRASVAVMGDGCPSVEDMAEKLRRKQDELAEERAAVEQRQLDVMALRVRASFGGARDQPYTDQEVLRFAVDAGCSTVEMKRRLIVQAKGGYYLFHDGAYLPPVTKDELLLAAERDLSPFHPHGVGVWRRTEDGALRPKGIQDLVLDYGDQARHVVVDMAAQKSWYDAATKTIVEAPTPLRDLEPERSDAVEQWLLALGWEQPELLLDWIASAPFLDEPIAALYLHGPPDCGKTLFAEALSRLWTVDGSTAMEDAVSDFNEAVLKCPLVFADERMPRKLKENGGTGDLRQMVQARSRSLSRKFKPPATLKGSLRIVLAANNMHMLDSDEMLTPEDSAALAERILYLRVGEAAAKVLAGFGFDVVRRFVDDDLVAKHALWLCANRDVERRHRFLVSGIDSKLHRSLVTSRGLAAAVGHWCVEYLLAPSKVDAKRDLLVRVRDGQLFVTARGLSENWDQYKTGYDRTPAQGRISRALSSLSDPKRQMRAANGKPTNYWPVRTENLLTWNEEHGYCTDEEILDALKHDTTVDGAVPAPDNVVGMRGRKK